jgi:hypothetical protein
MLREISMPYDQEVRFREIDSRNGLITVEALTFGADRYNDGRLRKPITRVRIVSVFTFEDSRPVLCPA